MSQDTDSIVAALAGVTDPGRVSAPRLKEGIASIILDVTGLSGEDRAQLERNIRPARRRHLRPVAAANHGQ
jgi:ATP-binding protein involved in chromosome partitioning